MSLTDEPRRHLQEWRTVLGGQPLLGPEQPGRELWPVTADGREYFLKRLGPWRNLPVADQARVLSYLAHRGVRVAEFMITDSARLYAGHLEDSFVLLPLIVHDRPDEDESLVRQPIAGRSVADLHAALADYPWAANSYREQFVEALTGELLLPADVLDPFERHRAGIVDRLAPLPHQLVHGDLTPDNVLISRDDNTAAFIDFDHLPLAPRVWDLGKYLSRLLRSTSPEAALPGAAAFVAGYHEVTALSEEELDALPAAIITMNLLEVDWVTRILTGRLERRLLPSQEAELTGAVGALRWQFHRWGDLSTALRAGLR